MLGGVGRHQHLHPVTDCYTCRSGRRKAIDRCCGLGCALSGGTPQESLPLSTRMSTTTGHLPSRKAAARPNWSKSKAWACAASMEQLVTGLCIPDGEQCRKAGLPVNPHARPSRSIVPGLAGAERRKRSGSEERDQKDEREERRGNGIAGERGAEEMRKRRGKDEKEDKVDKMESGIGGEKGEERIRKRRGEGDNEARTRGELRSARREGRDSLQARRKMTTVVAGTDLRCSGDD